MLRASHSGGSALPGKVVLSFDPHFLRRMLKKIPYGIILVSGTNGKTTTTHIIRELLQEQGLRVFSNQTGSNFSRGIASELLHRSTLSGDPQADIAVLELDEAYGVGFSGEVNPDVSVFLNVFRDQMDRFGELENTAEMLTKIARNTTKLVILNQDDPYIMQIKEKFYDPTYATYSKAQHENAKGEQTVIDAQGEEHKVVTSGKVQFAYFSVDNKLRTDFITDSELYAKVESVSDTEEVANSAETSDTEKDANSAEASDTANLANSAVASDISAHSSAPLAPQIKPIISNDFTFNANVMKANDDSSKVLSAGTTYANRVNDAPDASVILKDYNIKEGVITAIYNLNGYDYTSSLALSGVHNALNAAAALATVRGALKGKVDGSKLVNGLGKIGSPFGRGERIIKDGIEYDIILVKNPAGFRLALKSYEPDDVPVMIAINDEYADSRDTSWLYDVDHDVLEKKPGWSENSVISGRRASELALKFTYAFYPATFTEPDLEKAVQILSEFAAPTKKRRIYATYTAMLSLRSILLDKKGSSL